MYPPTHPKKSLRVFISWKLVCQWKQLPNGNVRELRLGTPKKSQSFKKINPNTSKRGPNPKMTLVAGHPLHSPHPKTLSTFYSLTNSCRRRSHPDSGNWGSGTQKGSVWSLARDSESATTSAARTRGKSPRALEKKLLGGGGRASMALIEH